MTYDTDMDIIALSPFEPNPMFATTEDSDTIRRFTTLLDCGAVGGGSHHLRKVANTEGETFALKTLWPLSGCDENGSAVSPSGIKTLTEEYRNLAVVSLLGGFPKTYGYGYAGNTPVILMEWIEGLPLRDAAAELTDPAEGGPICSCGRDLACFCGAFHDLCGGAADLNRFVQPGLTTIVYAHSSTKTTDMIS